MEQTLPLFYRLLILVLISFVFLPPHSIRATAGQLSDNFITTQTDLEALLTTARANIASYPTVFKDLAAEETKTVEIYEKPGALSGKRRIVSDFIVYQSQRDPAVMTEYRNVREVDGGAVSMMFSVFSPVKLIAGKAPEMYLRGRTINEYTSFKRFDVKMQEKTVPPVQQPRPN
jgi:hypothetical protein